jgi:ribosomal protein RSM22 (predicted rRNA methylase)
MSRCHPLPRDLQAALEEESLGIDLVKTARGRAELTSRYRSPEGRQCIVSEAERQAYLFCRLPATYASLAASLEAAAEQGNWQPDNLLDLGAGPGTGLWAASSLFPSLSKATLVERDPSMIALGKRLAEKSANPLMQQAHWMEADLEKLGDLPLHDLVLFSYSIGEIHLEAVLPLLEHAWKATGELMLILEPGTPAGFERIRMIRETLIQWGAHIAAPCPHHLSCPMAGADWCHFAARLERSFLHRKLKGGTMGYEDEKFSYIAVSKKPVLLPLSRILSDPVPHSGHVDLKLCTKENGLQRATVSKRLGAVYKTARKCNWGDSLNYPSIQGTE